MKELSLREIQLGELEILKRLDGVCREQGLRYFLFGGTMIGAVRHQGFIPWDDDIDIAMPRKDYDRLLAWWQEHAAQEEPLRMITIDTNPDYVYAIARLSDVRYRVDYEGVKDYGLGLFVDIYPFDGCGNSQEEAEPILRAALQDARMTLLTAVDYFSASRSGGALRTAAKFAGYLWARLHGSRYYIRRLIKRAKAHPYEQSDYVGCTIWDPNFLYIYRREDLEELIDVPFEDGVFPIPAAYDRVLRHSYGDYMQLPPEEDRVGHHYYKAYLREETKEEESR